MSHRDLGGTAAVVTGGTDGIGRAIATRLAAAGAEVIIVGRDRNKGAGAARGICETTGNRSVEFMPADLNLMREAERLADAIRARFPKLHRLVHCAGVIHGRRTETEEGIESNFAVNYLSRFCLTQQLMEALRKGGSPVGCARILVVSGAAQNGKIHYDDVNLARGFGILRMVAQFCQANDLFVHEQAQRLGENSDITITALKVGVVKTNIRGTFPGWMKVLVPLLFDPFLAQTTEQIADSAWQLLTAPEYERASGALFRHIKKFRRLHFEPERNEGRSFWLFSEQLVERVLAAAA